MQAADTEKSSPANENLTPDQIETLRERDNLTLSRRRILHELQSSHYPRRQQMLRDALAFLDQKLAELK
ncbi:MAG: hypothetical protein M1482_14945 [Chloroflexi bacterium]|nr:hypothetical protein [Chloroflexota bacterium]